MSLQNQAQIENLPQSPKQNNKSNKLVNLLQSHAILPVSRESVNLSQSSKKHRELKKAQELSIKIYDKQNSFTSQVA
jgi:hypothetical protein